MQETRIPIGISSCLLGEAVRFDGGHKRDHYITRTLGQHFHFIPFCPEMAIGLGAPRQTLRLIRIAPPEHLPAKPGRPDAQHSGEIRVRGNKTHELDVTDALRASGAQQASRHPELCGYILKSKSPSCGMERVTLYRDWEGKRPPEKTGVGQFAETFMAARPELPCEEEGRLGDPVLRDNFITRVFTLHRWRTLVRDDLNAKALLDFHTAHKLLLLAHHPQTYTDLGRLLSNLRHADLEALSHDYLLILMRGLRHIATRGKNANVLQHLVGYLRAELDDGDRDELRRVIDDYREGHVPLIVPITLLRHHFRRHPHPYVAGQVYLEPHPPELMLRNGV
ncbi:MAG: YbgA family protein [Pseudomonadota bacterium]